jgi:hypothetical protein
VLTSVLGVLLASMGSGPHALLPDDVCLVQGTCAPPPVYCLVEGPACDAPGEGEVCLVAECGGRERELRLQP